MTTNRKDGGAQGADEIETDAARPCNADPNADAGEVSWIKKIPNGGIIQGIFSDRSVSEGSVAAAAAEEEEEQRR